MSCRGGAGLVRGGTSALQPLRATVPFQLHSKTQLTTKDAKTAEKARSLPPKPSIRRTLSLDTVIGPYLQGQWPKETEQQGVDGANDKATQVSPRVRRPPEWAEKIVIVCVCVCVCVAPPQTAPVPIPQTALSRLTPRLCHSVEGLNQELEGVFVREMPEEQHRVLEVPDGHRAPPPSQRCNSSSQSDPSPALLSSSPSPCSSTSPFPPGEAPDLDAELLGCGTAEPSFLLLSSSPRPNKSYTFQREPPEGCERVRVAEEAQSTCVGQTPFPSSRPDPNKVNFTPHGGSAFCPVSLLKPLLPTVDFLFRNLSVSPVTGCSGQSVGPYQPVDGSTTAT
ncbi:protein FAM117A-like isoform X1 [Arapaima gigas]